MEGLKSFYKDRVALEQLVKSGKVAFVQAGDMINFHEDYHCKVKHLSHLNLQMRFQFQLFFFQIYSVWKGHVPLFTFSMYMEKQSPLTPFIAHGIRKMAESGITNLHTKRHIVSEPNCKHLRSKGRPLGLDKFASLFTFYIIACVVSLIILVIEIIYKSISSKNKTQGFPSMQSHNKEELIRKIDALKDDIMNFLDKKSLHHKENILLTIEKIYQLNMVLLNLNEIV